MRSFSTFLTESANDESKLKHLEHTEDHPLHAGEAGYHHTVANLHAVHNALKGKPTEGHHITTKMDGSPSVVFGHHPKNGKFFVATKSAFNKNPKINHTEEDIEKNHGHAPGLVQKLKHALHHLPKVTPKHGVYQGDIMHSQGDVKSHSDHLHFKPNTVEYSVHKDSPEGKKVAKSKFGIAIHTKYHGHDLESMHAGFHVDHENFKDHPDVHKMSIHTDTSKAKYSTLAQKQFKHHMAKAEEHHNALKGKYGDLHNHGEHIKTYINHTVRTGEEPSHAGYVKHVSGRLSKEVDKVKTDSVKQKKQEIHDNHISHAKQHKDTIHNALQLHKHLQKAKDHLVTALSSHHEYTHTVGDEHVKPEGFVSVLHGRPSKFVDRNEFSKHNFANNDSRKSVTEEILNENILKKLFKGKKKDDEPHPITDEEAEHVKAQSDKLNRGYVNDYHQHIKSYEPHRYNINIHSHSKKTGNKKEGYLHKNKEGLHLTIAHYSHAGSTHKSMPLVHTTHKVDDIHKIHELMNE